MILQESRPLTLPVLSESGKQMILRRLLQEHQGELTIFSRAADRSGFVSEISGMISELRQYEKTPAQLLEQREQLRHRGGATAGPLADKLGDLALIFQAYQDYLTDRLVDPDDFLDLMSSRCPEAKILQGGRLWIDGFAGFTGQQYRALKSLTCHAEEARISLCVDPNSPAFKLTSDGGKETFVDDTELFAATLETYSRLCGMFRAVGGEVLPAITLPGGRLRTNCLPRFKRSGPLARLERNFLRPGDTKTSTKEQPPTAENVRCTSVKDIPIKDIVIVEAAHRRGEVEAAAGHILRLCRECQYRFRDIAVILRDFTDYQELIEAVFEDHAIAYFLDQRRSVRHHPLIELLRETVAVLSSDFKTEQVLSLLKTDLMPLSRTACDTLENYVLAHGIQHGSWYSEKNRRYHRGQTPEGSRCPQNNESSQSELTSEELNQYRRRAVGPLLELRNKLYGEKFQAGRALSIKRITTELFGFLEAIGAAETLLRWYQREQDQRNFDLAQTHQQVYEQVIALLEDLVEGLGDVTVTLGQYGEILNAALGQMTLGLVPPVLDQVLVGTIERSRHPDIKAAFVLGVNEGRFPRVAGGNNLLTDTQRQLLAQYGFELAPDGTKRLLHERYLGYIALMRPREFLWVSYPVSDEKANVINPSCFIDEIRVAVNDVVEVRMVDSDEPDLTRTNNLLQLGQQLAVTFSTWSGEEAIGTRFLPLYQYALSRDDWASTLRNILAGVDYQNVARLEEQTVKKLYSHISAGSVSRLESFAACPFQHFARYTLGLKEREELKLAPLEMGTYYHRIVYQMFCRLQQEKLTWDQLSDEQIDQFIEEITAALARQDYKTGELLEQSGRNRYLLNNAAERMRWFCRCLRQAAGAGNFRQCYAELEFGTENSTIGPLKIEVSDGGQLALRGKIDRVDVGRKDENRYGLCVIDYKSSARSFPYAQFYYGLSLQLISYLLVLQTQSHLVGPGAVEPAAALYLPVHPSGKPQES